MKKSWWIYLVLIPPFAVLFTFTIWPIIQSFLLSFQHWSIRSTEWVGLAQYRRLVADPIFRRALINTFYYTIVVVPGSIVIALFLSELIFPLPHLAQTLFKSAFYLPGVVSAVVIALVWRWIYNANNYGLLNYLLSYFNVRPIGWLQEPNLALPALMATTLIGGQGAAVVLILAAMGSIPRHLYESARLDGSSRWTEFVFITLPLLKPTLLYLLIMGTIASFQVFTGIYLLTHGGPNNATTTVVFSIFQTGFSQFNFSYASAQAVVLFLITIVFSIFIFKFLSEDIEF